MIQTTGSGPIPQKDVLSIVNREIAKLTTQKELLAVTGMTGEQVYQMYAMISEGYEAMWKSEKTGKIKSRIITVNELCSFYFSEFGKDESELEPGVLDDMRKKYDSYISDLESTTPLDPRTSAMLETAKRERAFLK